MLAMNTLNYKKELTEFTNLVESLEEVPTIGKKSALRLALLLGLDDKITALKLAHALEEAVAHVQICEACGALSCTPLCPICSDEDRGGGQLCVVLHERDIFTIEELGIYEGRYIRIDENAPKIDFKKIAKRVEDEGIKEIIFAFTPSVANNAITTLFEDYFSGNNILFSRIAHGIPSNIGLENVDLKSIQSALTYRYVME